MVFHPGLHAGSAGGQRSRSRTHDQGQLLPLTADRANPQDSLGGVPVEINAQIIMETLFGFGQGNYYRYVNICTSPAHADGQRRSGALRLHCGVRRTAGRRGGVPPEGTAIVGRSSLIRCAHIAYSFNEVVFE